MRKIKKKRKINIIFLVVIVRNKYLKSEKEKERKKIYNNC